MGKAASSSPLRGEGRVGVIPPPDTAENILEKIDLSVHGDSGSCAGCSACESRCKKMSRVGSPLCGGLFSD